MSSPVDNSFVKQLQSHLEEQTEDSMQNLISTEAARKTHAHALTFGNTQQGLVEFWREILSRMDVETVMTRLAQSLTFLEENEDVMREVLREILEYLPTTTVIHCQVLAMAGYDIGIVSEGSPLVNIAHPLFEKDPRELIVMSMHELHHVGYTEFHPIYGLQDLQRTSDLLRAVKYSTHLEGMAVYAPLKRRMEMDILTHPDYQALLDEEVVQRRSKVYFKHLHELESEEDREICEDDLEILDIMSGRDLRLWYVVGGHMAREIDKNLGREELVKTVVEGADYFLDAYERL